MGDPPPLSDEQNHIYEQILLKKNVIVDACAGSGKSTTVLSLARLMPHTKILQMTYNADLRKEVKEKIKSASLENIKVHTFHSIAVKYYLSSAHTDTGIRYLLYNKLKPRHQIWAFDLLVLDEAQDMTYLFFQFIVKLCRDIESRHRFQLLVMGDYMQGLYEFKGSDIRFLTLGDKIWEQFDHLISPHFVKCTLKTSYRITRQMAAFVNHVMLDAPRVEACKDGPRVTYIRRSQSVNEGFIAYQILRLIDEEGANPSDFFVLGASVKGRESNIRKIENRLVESGIPCLVPMMESDKIDERVIGGKVVFSSFHGVKGRQRKYVFVTGFDNSYFTWNAKNAPRNICPNTLYVACTRATHELYVLESSDWDSVRPLEFLKMNHHEMNKLPYMTFKGIPRTLWPKESEKAALAKLFTPVTPTSLIQFVPESVIEEISPLLDKIFVKELLPRKYENPFDQILGTNSSQILGTNNSQVLENNDFDLIDLPTVVQTRKGFFEDVSDLNGIAIPCIYYDYLLKKTGTNTNPPNVLKLLVEDNLASTKKDNYKYLKRIVGELPDNCTNVSDYLYLANVHVAVQERLYFKLNQIDRDEYTWLTDAMIGKCLERIDDTVGQELVQVQELVQGQELVLGNLQENKERGTMPIMEKTIIHQSEDAKHERIDAILGEHFDKKFRFTARIDLMTTKTIWELKCTSKLSIDHYLQVVIYMWLWRMVKEVETNAPDDQAYNKKECNDMEFRILNIKTGELLRVDATTEELTEIVLAILKGKFGEPIVKTDEEFIADCCYHLI